MNEYAKKHIALFGRHNQRTRDILNEQGALFCSQSVAKDDYETAIHGRTPLLSFEPDGKCSSMPTVGTLVFVRFPDNTADCFEYRKPLVQREIAEIVCICGVCHNWMRKRSKKGSGKRNWGRIPWIGVANNKFRQDIFGTLANRMETWQLYGDNLGSTQKSIRGFMLGRLDQRLRDIAVENID